MLKSIFRVSAVARHRDDHSLVGKSSLIVLRHAHAESVTLVTTMGPHIHIRLDPPRHLIILFRVEPALPHGHSSSWALGATGAAWLLGIEGSGYEESERGDTFAPKLKVKEQEWGVYVDTTVSYSYLALSELLSRTVGDLGGVLGFERPPSNPSYSAPDTPTAVGTFSYSNTAHLFCYAKLAQEGWDEIRYEGIVLRENYLRNNPAMGKKIDFLNLNLCPKVMNSVISELEVRFKHPGLSDWDLLGTEFFQLRSHSANEGRMHHTQILVGLTSRDRILFTALAQWRRFRELPQLDFVQFASLFIVMFVAATSGFVVGKFSNLRRKAGSLKLERPPKRIWILGLLLIVCALTFKLSHRLPALDIICSIALSRIRTKLHISLRKIITYFFPPLQPPPFSHANFTNSPDFASDDLDSHHDDPEVNDNLSPPFGEYVPIDSISEEDRQHTVTIPRRVFEGLLSDFKTAYDDAQGEIRALSRMLRDLTEQNAYLEEENRSLSGVVEIPPDYNQAVEEGAFDEWSAAVVSGAAAFAPPRRDAPPSYDPIELGDPQNTTGIPTPSQATHSDSHLKTSIEIDPSQPKPRAPIVSILSSLLFFSSNLELSSSENIAR
ncbi:hypothetical protein C0995_008951 [Termitomyces sp. Mi166|nr:hypothetical protein C0995_008951 [Termitomyces sp. Mi166\